MASFHGLLLAATVYGWAALAAFLFLARTWRGVENGLRPAWVAVAWPAVLPGLAAYYAGAGLYTLGIVLNARRKAGPVVAVKPVSPPTAIGCAHPVPAAPPSPLCGRGWPPKGVG